MLRVELDIFSGRPNPSWTLSPGEERELVERLMADSSLVLPAHANTGGLGYRGYIVTVLSEEAEGEARRVRLPSRFRIGGARSNQPDASLWLLETSDKPNLNLNDDVRDFAQGAIETSADSLRSTQAPSVRNITEENHCTSNYLTSSTNFTFWNDPNYITRNNCYNYASNRRTNTFAQPGRATGNLFAWPPSCGTIDPAMASDGWRGTCQSNNLSICLVIWPNTDFHFYRLCTNGIWCHKPGQTAARNKDNSGNVITNPQTCNRGSYTTFCFYSNGNNSTLQIN